MNNLKEIVKKTRREILKMHFLSQESHIGSALSCADILAVLYFKIINKNQDRFILSKSHAVAALYAVLSQKGFFAKDILKTYCKDENGLPGHCTKLSVPGVEVSTGSLGHGLPMGAGMALASKRDKTKQRVFVLMGDGECDEGSVWEAAAFCSHHKLDNLTAIIDRNKLQGLGNTAEVLDLEPFKEKWESFGWGVKEIDGHNLDQIERALISLPFKKDRPNVIIANTTKGKGVSFMEDRLEWHYKSPTEEQYKLALKELS